MAIIPLHTV